MSATESNLTQPMQGRVDLPSRQLINDEVLISQLGRTRVREGEQFDRRFADQVMQKHLHRNRPPTTVKFLVDRMRFTKRGYHKYLPYRDVEHFYRPEEQSNAFLLFVRTTKGRHSYETYRCPNPEDVTHVKEMIDYAGYNQQKLLNSNYGSYYSSSRPESRSSIASSEYYSNDRPVSRLSRASSRSRHSEYVDVYYPSTDCHPV
ncbi:hypothetical protein FGIG_04646 [Fasciola gigantica]|uniref:Trematode PH-like domain-containing protein n=1 Tax=Fasciola gigantica TaxID=46835 RepID=A0A504YHE2_FASGI|nr:hypothetical protein FGIG_04646 [Fasciola gigantica]